MALPTLPGRSYAYMCGLLNQFVSVLTPTPITKFTMLSIFWEETMFNNILQDGAGTAVGFGQAEPYEFWRFDADGKLSDLARKNNYLVHGLPRRNGKVLLGQLNDPKAVEVACAMVRDLFERNQRTKKQIMYAYGGVGFKGTQPVRFQKTGGREAVIQGILDCESALGQAKTPDDILAALKKARAFNADDDFKRVLFPHTAV